MNSCNSPCSVGRWHSLSTMSPPIPSHFDNELERLKPRSDRQDFFPPSKEYKHNLQSRLLLSTQPDMASHTPWYPKDDPPECLDTEHSSTSQDLRPYRQTPTRERPGVSSQPFRFVTYTDDAPYPLHESAHHANQPGMIDLISGDVYRRVGSIRQPLAEDFLRPEYPLLAPPAKGHDSDQESSTVELASCSPAAPASEHLAPRSLSAGAVVHTPASTRPLCIVQAAPALRHSQSMVAIPSDSRNALQGSATPDRRDKGSAVPVIATDTFSSALGGLHRLPTAPTRKPSKLDRIKRFFSLRRHRQYGRVSR
jgi:hypothetical protein